MKLLLISLSVVFCFSCSKDTPTSPKIELDTSLKEYTRHRYITEYKTPPTEEWVETNKRFDISIKWRFISYSPSDTFGGVKVKGGFTTDYSNPNPNSVMYWFNMLKFFDKDDILIAEDDVGNIERYVRANGNGSYSLDFVLDLDNISLANEITRATTWGNVYIYRYN